MEKNSYWPDMTGLWKQISKEARLAFFSALAVGFIVHFYLLGNLLINHDAAGGGLNTTNNFVSSGRWTLGFFSSFSGTYQLPMVIGLLTLLSLALSAALTVRVLEISQPICVVLTSGFIASYPCIASIFAYLYTADAYFFAPMLCALAVYLTKHFRFGWIPAALCVAAALGIYQSFVGYAVGLFLFDCILALFTQKPVKEIVKQGIFYILILLISLILYRVLLQLSLSLNHIAMGNYKGMSDALNSGPRAYFPAVPAAYRDFFGFLLRRSQCSYLLNDAIRHTQWLLFLFSAACGLFLTIHKQIYKKPLRLLLLVTGVLLIPPAVNLITVIAAGFTYTSMLMRYPFVLVFVFCVKLIEMAVHCLPQIPWPRGRHTAFLRKGPALLGLALCAAMIWHNFCLCNTAYLSLKLTYESSYATAVRIVDRIENTEGYLPGMPVRLYGSALSTYGSSAELFPELDGFHGISDLTLLNDYCGMAYINTYLGANLRYVYWSQRPAFDEAVQASGVLNSMAPFPSKSSVQLFNGYVIVKLS